MVKGLSSKYICSKYILCYYIGKSTANSKLKLVELIMKNNNVSQDILLNLKAAVYDLMSKIKENRCNNIHKGVKIPFMYDLSPYYCKSITSNFLDYQEMLTRNDTFIFEL